MKLVNILLVIDWSFITRFDFWLFLILTIWGISISWKAWKEASKAFIQAQKATTAATDAKNAADKAGEKVRKYSISYEIGEAIRMCKINQGTIYTDSNDKITDLHGKIRYMLESIRGDLSVSHPELIKKIQDSNNNIVTQFNLIESTAQTIDIYTTMRPFILELNGNLSELQAVLGNDLTINIQ